MTLAPMDCKRTQIFILLYIYKYICVYIWIAVFVYVLLIVFIDGRAEAFACL